MSDVARNVRHACNGTEPNDSALVGLSSDSSTARLAKVAVNVALRLQLGRVLSVLTVPRHSTPSLRADHRAQPEL